jgi:hypothetical protein
MDKPLSQASNYYIQAIIKGVASGDASKQDKEELLKQAKKRATKERLNKLNSSTNFKKTY